MRSDKRGNHARDINRRGFTASLARGNSFGSTGGLERLGSEGGATALSNSGGSEGTSEGQPFEDVRIDGPFRLSSLPRVRNENLHRQAVQVD